MNLISKYFKILSKILFVGKAVLRQKSFIKKQLIPQINPYFQSTDETLSEKDYKKITKYYGLIVPAILGELICFLRGQKMSLDERKYSTYQSSVTGLVDDFFDVQNLSLDEVKKIVAFEKAPSNSSEELFDFLHSESLEFYKTRKGYLESLDQVLQVQEDSKKQFQQGLQSREELLDLTIRKGGESFLYYVRLYIENITPQDEKFFYLLGGITQFGNDIFDLYEDIQENVDTLLTTTTSITEVKEIFLNLIKEVFQLSQHVSFNKIDTFLEFYSIGVFNRCIVCLEQYESLQENTPSNLFQPKNNTRKELICDMEKPSNLLRSFTMDIKKEINLSSISSK
ncbi:hypothetical protein [Flammeovirga aprica]|uniref:Uncharacterized protein n=1 Tax=Flammeovirga aprica JL-4 TaxID=694437 RepID=A0A7X9S133_9BACT|nr:hypothetical protein [Flammeovirga aprica]NME72309.1 hypothetical protein [Flammeovirga aprica JL-4]